MHELLGDSLIHSREALIAFSAGAGVDEGVTLDAVVIWVLCRLARS